MSYETSYGEWSEDREYRDWSTPRDPQLVALEEQNAKLQETIEAMQNQVQTAKAEALAELRSAADAQQDYAKRTAAAVAEITPQMDGRAVTEVYRKYGL